MTDINELISQINSGFFTDRFLEVYVDDSHAAKQPARYTDALNRFKELFGDGKVDIYSAPGRTEVGGNHTDHQHGEVLAASINLDAIAVARPLNEPIIKLVSGDDALIAIDIEDNYTVKENEYGTTLSLIKGVLQGFLDRNYRIGGFEAYITSDVLIGAGLSSSAAFETLIVTILSYMYNGAKVDSTTIAIIGQFAENIFFGKPCGLMDQLACSTGGMVHINFADSDNPAIEAIDPTCINEQYSLCITNTLGSHADLTDEYAAIPAEMKSVAKFFNQELLCSITTEMLLNNATSIRTQCGDRALLRALHFTEENLRVQQEVAAIKSNDITTFIELVKASGNSSYKYLQNVYSSRNPQTQNVSVALCASDIILKTNEACRVHGGGFAGTIQGFVLNENSLRYCDAMNKLFNCDNACQILSIRKYGGIKIN